MWRNSRLCLNFPPQYGRSKEKQLLRDSWKLSIHESLIYLFMQLSCEFQGFVEFQSSTKQIVHFVVFILEVLYFSQHIT